MFVTQWGDNAHFFRSTRLCGLMMTTFWRPYCEGLWEQIKCKYSIAWAPWWFVGTRLIARKLSENRMNLEIVSTMISPTTHTLNLLFYNLFIKKWVFIVIYQSWAKSKIHFSYLSQLFFSSNRNSQYGQRTSDPCIRRATFRSAYQLPSHFSLFATFNCNCPVLINTWILVFEVFWRKTAK